MEKITKKMVLVWAGIGMFLITPCSGSPYEDASQDARATSKEIVSPSKRQRIADANKDVSMPLAEEAIEVVAEKLLSGDLPCPYPTCSCFFSRGVPISARRFHLENHAVYWKQTIDSMERSFNKEHPYAKVFCSKMKRFAAIYNLAAKQGKVIEIQLR